MKKVLLPLLAAAMAVPAAYAVKAKPGIHTIPQPDGTTIEVMLVGNEHHHMYMTADSVPLRVADDGFMHYATIDPATGALTATGVRASATVAARSDAERALVAGIDSRAVRREVFGRKSPRKAARRSISQTGVGVFDDSFPRKGDVKALVILVNYKDVKFSTPNPAQYFSDMLMKEGFSEYGGTGSARDYFVDNSMGQFRPEFDCYGPVELPQNRSYYGKNVGFYEEDSAPEDMIIHAVQILDDDVDFSQYDTDGDGFVDNVYVFYAGIGETTPGADSNTVWPHSFNIYSGCGKVCQADGVTFDYYACSNEWDSGKPDGIGTFVHEFSHVLGLPDLYDVDYADAEYLTPNEWSVLDMGNYNNDSRTPAGYSAYERNALGWNEPVVLDGEAIDAELEHIATSNGSYLIPTEKDSEFYLLENRQQTGWDSYLPYHGMLIWHIDFNASKWRLNEVNTTASHQYVDIVEANNNANSKRTTTLRGYCWPGTAKNTSFTSSTTPALKSWAGKETGIAITDIAENGGKITFKVNGGAANSGIPDIDADGSDAPVEYYNLQGVRVANPGTGLYIKKQGDTAVKVMIRE